MSDTYRVNIEIEGKDPAWVIGGVKSLLSSSSSQEDADLKSSIVPPQSVVLRAADGTKAMMRNEVMVIEFPSTEAARHHGKNIAAMQEHCTRYLITPTKEPS